MSEMDRDDPLTTRREAETLERLAAQWREVQRRRQYLCKHERREYDDRYEIERCIRCYKLLES